MHDVTIACQNVFSNVFLTYAPSFFQFCPCHECFHPSADLHKGHATLHVPGAGGGEALWPHGRPLVPGLHPVWASHRGAPVLHQLHLSAGAADRQGSREVAGEHGSGLHGTEMLRGQFTYLHAKMFLVQLRSFVSLSVFRPGRTSYKVYWRRIPRKGFLGPTSFTTHLLLMEF